jgi:hypothetical protein
LKGVSEIGKYFIKIVLINTKIGSRDAQIISKKVIPVSLVRIYRILIKNTKIPLGIIAALPATIIVQKKNFSFQKLPLGIIAA